MPAPDEMCGACRFFLPHADPGEGDGLCRRHAPRPGCGDVDDWNFPVTDQEDWCGEFQERKPHRVTGRAGDGTCPEVTG